MFKTLAATVAALAVAVTPVVVASPAHAASPDCVTKREFRGVERGWAMQRVHRRFDVKGRLVGQSGAYRIREYRSCHRPAYDYIAISYDHGRVDYKSAYWW